MTPRQQKHFYFPAWSDCAKRHSWRMAQGRLAAAPPVEDRTLPELLAVWRAAAERARADHRAIIPDDLRHACHIIACGADKSSTALNNRETNSVVALFRYLTDPDDLAFARAWEHPENAEIVGLIEHCRSIADEAYIIAMSQHICDKLRCAWTELPVHSLRRLARDVRERSKQFHAPVTAAPEPEPKPEPEPAVEADNIPF